MRISMLVNPFTEHNLQLAAHWLAGLCYLAVAIGQLLCEISLGSVVKVSPRHVQQPRSLVLNCFNDSRMAVTG